MSKDPNITTASGRYFLTDRIRDKINFQSTPQAQGLPRPLVQKPFPAESRIIPLPDRDNWPIPLCNLEDAMAERQSHRHFTGEPAALNWQVYILRCSDHSLYTGITTDIARRFQQHLAGRGAKYFRGRQPLQVVYLETEHSRASASRREAFIKGLKRAEKERLLLNAKSEAP